LYLWDGLITGPQRKKRKKAEVGVLGT